MPLGRAPEALRAGAGMPLVATVKMAAVPEVKLAALALVIAGAVAGGSLGPPDSLATPNASISASPTFLVVVETPVTLITRLVVGWAGKLTVRPGVPAFGRAA